MASASTDGDHALIILKILNARWKLNPPASRSPRPIRVPFPRPPPNPARRSTDKAEIRKFVDVRSAGRTRFVAVHCFDHGRRARAVLARRSEQQRRALWVRKIDDISDAQRRFKIDAAGCRHDITVIGATLFALRQRVGDRRGKALERHRRNAAPATPPQEDGKRGPKRGNARQHAARRSGIDCHPRGA